MPTNPFITYTDAQELNQETYNSLQNQIGGVVSGFKGVIMIADTVTEDGVYSPGESGTYTKAGNLEYNPDTTDKGFSVKFIKKDSAWTKNRVELTVEVINDLTTGGETKALSAEQGKILSEKTNNLEPYSTVISTQHFNKYDYLRGFLINNEGFLLDTYAEALTTKIIPIPSGATQLRLSGLSNGFVKIIRWLDINSDFISPVDTLGSSYKGGTFNIPVPAIYVQVYFRNRLELNDEVLQSFFMYFATSPMPKDFYKENVKIGDAYVNLESSNQFLYSDTLPDVNSSITMTEGNLTKISHVAIGGAFVFRTDSFTYPNNQIKEVRTLYNGEKLEITTNLITLITNTQYYGV